MITIDLFKRSLKGWFWIEDGSQVGVEAFRDERLIHLYDESELYIKLRWIKSFLQLLRSIAGSIMTLFIQPWYWFFI